MPWEKGTLAALYQFQMGGKDIEDHSSTVPGKLLRDLHAGAFQGLKNRGGKREGTVSK